MLNFAELSLEALNELKNKTIQEISRRIADRNDFYGKIHNLKELLSAFEDDRIALEIEGADIYLRFIFEHGIRADFDELDNSDSFDIEEYNENSYEQLFIVSNDKNEEIDNFYIPLDDEFEATTDVSVLDYDEFRDYESIRLIIQTESITYIFSELD